MLNTLKYMKNIFLQRPLKALGLTLGIASGCLASVSGHAAGLLTPNDGSPALELAEHHVSVVIENGFAVTEVDQTFRNPYQSDKDALYSFPIPDNAAVGEFTFWIDGKPIHAEVLEKKQARQLHEQQQQQGLDSALLEQGASRTFDIQVSPVRAQQDVRIRLVYLQQLPVDHSMGRYVYPLEDGGVDVQANNFWSRNESVSDAFSFNLHLRSAYPVDAMRVTNGEGSVQQIDSGEWQVTIDKQSGSGAVAGSGLSDGEVNERMEQNLAPNAKAPVYSLDKDIVVYWRLNENLPGTVDLVTYKEQGASAGTFMLTLTPGIDLAPITEGRDWIFVLDTSGSMRGKFNTLIDGLERSLRALGSNDRYRVVLFSDSAKHLGSDLPLTANAQNIRNTLQTLDAHGVSGGTNLYDGIKMAVKAADQDRTTALVLVTDGVANMGPTEMKDFLTLIDTIDLRIFTAVMGNSANTPLLEGLTQYSEGFSVSVSNHDDMLGLMMQVVSKVTHEAMHNIDISIDGVRTRNLTKTKFSRVYRGEQLIVMGQFSGSGAAKVTLSTEISGTRQSYQSNLVFEENSILNPELERLWAFASIQAMQAEQDLIGETHDSRRGITDMAVQHGLVTEYTSLISVSESAFEAAGITRENAKRIENERAARTKRQNSAISSTRQDLQTPAFPNNRPVHRSSGGGGGGSVGGLLLILLLVLGVIRLGLGIHDAVSKKNDL